MRSVYKLSVAAAALLPLLSCNHDSDSSLPSASGSLMSKRDIAVMLASLPLGAEQVGEVYDAVESSSGNGYDEEYLMSDMAMGSATSKTLL